MTEFRVQRVVPKAVEEVWAAFTDPAALGAWFWPERFETTVEIDLRAGGEFRIASAPVGMAVSGTYQEVEEPARLVHTWRTLVPVDGGTGITILHERFSDPEAAEQNELGWNSCLDRLAPAAS